jgi:hypothetical protein
MGMMVVMLVLVVMVHRFTVVSLIVFHLFDSRAGRVRPRMDFRRHDGTKNKGVSRRSERRRMVHSEEAMFERER